MSELKRSRRGGAPVWLCAMLFVLLQGAAAPEPSFFTSTHPTVTRAALAVRADPATVDALAESSTIGDTYGGLDSAAHFDNCAWYQGRDWIHDHRSTAASYAYIYYVTGVPKYRELAFSSLGFVLHATEDFYAHSNWIETHSWGTLANFDGDPPAGWVSGTWSDETPKLCPPNSPTHGDLNKDGPSRPGYAEAYADAILAVQQQLVLFQKAVEAVWPADASAIMLKLGIRPQASRVDEALMLPNGKIAFFKGAKYSLYNWWLDAVEPGYPRSIAGDWPGLFAGGVDAAFVRSGNDKAYFFRGSQYTRYDLAAGQADLGYPKSIATNWPGLWTSGLDAAVRWPTGKVYFFKDAFYSRYDMTAGKVDVDYPKSIVGYWRGLEPFSDGIDAVFIGPNGKAYFFRGGHYIRYDVEADRADEGYPLSIADYWQGL